MPKSRKRKSSIGPIILIAAGVILILGILIWQVNANQPAAANSSGSATQAASNIVRVGLNEARAAYDEGSALFLDVRDPDSYAANHIPNALNIPLNQLEGRLKELDADQWIITYCT